jgi:hypothetical protein
MEAERRPLEAIFLDVCSRCVKYGALDLSNITGTSASEASMGSGNKQSTCNGHNSPAIRDKDRMFF